MAALPPYDPSKRPIHAVDTSPIYLFYIIITTDEDAAVSFELGPVVKSTFPHYHEGMYF